MRGYSDQEYSLINSKFDESNNLSLIDMEIRNDSSCSVRSRGASKNLKIDSL